MNFSYLLVDLCSISIPLICSFHPRFKLYDKWGALWPAILLAALPFIIWDSYFTKIGIWGFTPDYLLGVYFFDLPIEEILFFICIPYACLFTYFCFGTILDENYSIRYEKRITLIILGLLALGIILYNDRLYTLVTSVTLMGFLVYLQFFSGVKWLSKFYFSHLFLLIPFLIVNGILTGTGLDNPVVWYNNEENIGMRILTIPVEDVFYGMLMLLLNTFLFERFSGKYQTAER
jgi:lycopene cyclase domain-containing protein